MYLEAKETARLYKVLTEKLGSETTEAMFKYIDNKAERAVEANIKSLATKDDITTIRGEIFDLKIAGKEDVAIVRKELSDLKIANKEDIATVRKEIVATREDMAALKYELGNKIANTIRWSFVFWIGQAATTMGMIYLLIKK